MAKAKVNVDAGNVKVTHTGHSLYMIMGGGDFEHAGHSGLCGATVNGMALVVYVRSDAEGEPSASYVVHMHDVIDLAVAHHKKLKEKT
jgi:hypothetical protein